jgi:methylthioribose-1-phosphate isomerase
VENPAFDVTPAKYVAAIVTEKGIARAPYEESLRNLAADEVEARP